MCQAALAAVSSCSDTEIKALKHKTDSLALIWNSNLCVLFLGKWALLSTPMCSKYKINNHILQQSQQEFYRTWNLACDSYRICQGDTDTYRYREIFFRALLAQTIKKTSDWF